MTPSFSAPTVFVRVFVSLSCSADCSFFRRIWKLSYESEPVCLPRPWITASPAPAIAAVLRTSASEVGFGVVNVTWTPPLKSMPRFSPWMMIARTLSPTATSEMMK